LHAGPIVQADIDIRFQLQDTIIGPRRLDDSRIGRVVLDGLKGAGIVRFCHDEINPVFPFRSRARSTALDPAPDIGPQ